jgi:hypothetical protein
MIIKTEELFYASIMDSGAPKKFIHEYNDLILDKRIILVKSFD